MARIGGNPRLRLVDQDFDQDFQQQQPFELPSDAEELPTYEMGKDGVVSMVPSAPAIDEPAGHAENLVSKIDLNWLTRQGDDLVALVEQDIEERAPWRDRFLKGLELLGLVESDIDDGPFPGASNAVHPMIVEALTQFWARAFAELFPPDGPGKGKVWGKQDEQRIERATRVADYLNYEMTSLDEAYYSESSRLVWAVGLQGCAFRKTYRDPVLDRTIGIFVPAEDLIVPAEASDLKTTPRFTHRMKKSPNEIKRLQLVGYYDKVDLQEPTLEEVDEIKDAKNEAGDVVSDGSQEDVRHELFEISVELDIPGFEHTDPQTGQPTGLEVPYVVTIERASRKVLAVYRNWDEKDPLCRRKVYFDKYSFVPGMNFYDYGFIHLIGGLQSASTGALRVILDGAAMSSITGGFVAKNSGLKGESAIIEPGKWKQVQATGEDLKQAFFSPPVKEPSPVLFNIMGFLQEAGQRFSATTELQTGAGDSKNAPVGSTLAMIEQGQKVMSTIHSLMHKSLASELRLRYELADRFKPEQGYPYDVQGEPREVFANDFAPGIGIEPVSNPNIFSSVQRISMAQTVYQIALESGVIPVKKAVRRVLEAIRAPDIDEICPPDAEAVAYDPNGEIQAILMGKPVRVMPEQPHVEHLLVLAAFAANPGYGAHPEVLKLIGPALQSVMGQHMAYAWATAARQQQIPVGYMNPETGEMMQPPPPPQMGGMPGQMPMGQDGPPMGPGGPPAPQAPIAPPEVIAQLMAQIAPMLQQMPGLPQMPGAGGAGGDDAAAAAQKLKAADEKHQQDLQHAAQKHATTVAQEREKAAIKKESELTAQAIRTQGEMDRRDIKMQTATNDMMIAQQKSATDLAAKKEADDHALAAKQAGTQMDLEAKHQGSQIAQQDRELQLSAKQQQTELGMADREHATQVGQQDRQMQLADKQVATGIAAQDRVHKTALGQHDREAQLQDKQHAASVGQQDREHAATTKKADRNAALKQKQAAAKAKPAAKPKG